MLQIMRDLINRYIVVCCVFHKVSYFLEIYDIFYKQTINKFKHFYPTRDKSFLIKNCRNQNPIKLIKQSSKQISLSEKNYSLMTNRTYLENILEAYWNLPIQKIVFYNNFVALEYLKMDSKKKKNRTGSIGVRK